MKVEARDFGDILEQLCDYDHPLAEHAVVVMHALTISGDTEVRDDLFDAVTGIMDKAEDDQGDGSSRARVDEYSALEIAPHLGA